ncbi:AcrR family transcriptional regulator [Kitasatospora sp. MAA4]|uniref:TetR/AcrR family transcriptional regulator n=1 Tax=Kitasatospora sp. MAA4 TaxID=3035093 RepID=UPI002476AAEE|nr:TetR/AcrR family transcriptional regulator [Kitasatospora sp. MAA4]MDH6133750.1 AcrR family transcriptional regulator [Kitasatospora sp. MAA4]
MNDSPAPETGLRERKKAQTRALLRDTALQLFAERGFAGTTVTEIAERAGVSDRTFFRYFDSKESVLLPDLVDLFDQVEQELDARPSDEAPAAAVRAALLAAVRSPAAWRLAAFAHPGEDVQALVAARLVEEFVTFEERLTAAVERRLPPGPDTDLHAAVVAGTALAAARAVIRTARRRRSEGPYPVGAFLPLLPVAFDLMTDS